MAVMIAVAGKGGVGKTTISALILRALVKQGVRPILAVDADPNSNLHILMGLPMPQSLGSLREDILMSSDGSVTKVDMVTSKVQQSVAEGENVDLITMGRGEGPGCYCYVNNLLRRSLSQLTGSYKAVLVDNEAGMEHLSRRNLRTIDHLILIADPSPRGLETARTIENLATQLSLPIGNTWLLLNRPFVGKSEDEADRFPRPELEGVNFLVEVPYDPSLRKFEELNKPIIDIEMTCPAAVAVEEGIRTLFQTKL